MTDTTPEKTSGTKSETKGRRKRMLQVAAESRDAAVVSVYDPAMCCPTGVCGPSMDPELAGISTPRRAIIGRWSGRPVRSPRP